MYIFSINLCCWSSKTDLTLGHHSGSHFGFVQLSTEDHHHQAVAKPVVLEGRFRTPEPEVGRSCEAQALLTVIWAFPKEVHRMLHHEAFSPTSLCPARRPHAVIYTNRLVETACENTQKKHHVLNQPGLSNQAGAIAMGQLFKMQKSCFLFKPWSLLWQAQ